MAYTLHLLIVTGIFALLAASLNVASGYARLLSVCHAALFGIGAYTSALFLLRLHTPWLAAIAAAGAVGAAAGLLIGASTLRLKGDYFLMATLGIGEIAHSVMVNARPLTGGPIGIMNVPPPSVGRWIAADKLDILLLYAPLILCALSMLFLIERSPFARVLRALGDDELAAQVAGKRTPRFKLTALCLSGAVAALAGALYAHYVSYIDPSSFVFDVSLLVLAMVVLGGLGNLWGACAGTVVVLLVPEALRFAGLPQAKAAQIQQIAFGLALILMMVFRLRGVIPVRTLTVPDERL